MPKSVAPTPAPRAGGAPRFRLVRYFLLTSIVMFVGVAGVLAHFVYRQSEFFHGVQESEAAFFQRVQKTFAKEQDDAARRDLFQINEAAHVNITRLLANVLWTKDIAPVIERASQIPVDHCRAIADIVDPKDGKAKAPAEKKACFAEAGRRIAALPGFAELHAKVFDTMKSSTVYKIKVFDLRGVTVYSSELAQVGEDKLGNGGWRGAALEGVAKSELSYRDKFSAFEGVVVNRDVISSYLPMRLTGSPTVVGVFEAYSDVTPFLAQIKATSAQIARTAQANDAAVRRMSDENQASVERTGHTTLLVVLGLMALLFAALYAVVRRADRQIAEQARERERAQQHLAQSEKMASLGQMVAAVAHQLNTPIAFSKNNVSMAIDAIKEFEAPLAVAGRFSSLVKRVDADRVTLKVGAQTRAQIERIDEGGLDVAMPTEMLTDTLQGLEQMRELVQNLRDFTRLDRSKTVRDDLNRCLRNVVYIARSVIPTHIVVCEHYGELPEIICNPSQLNQVFLNLINNAAQAIGAQPGRIEVRTRADGARIVAEVADSGPGIPADVLPQIWETYFTTKKPGEGTGLGLPIARQIVEEHGGRIDVHSEPGQGATFTVELVAAAQPQRQPQPAPAPAPDEEALAA